MIPKSPAIVVTYKDAQGNEAKREFDSDHRYKIENGCLYVYKGRQTTFWPLTSVVHCETNF